MTAVRAQLEGLVETQRKKQLLAALIAALVEALLVAALLYALLRLGTPNLVMSKPRRLAVLALVLVSFTIALLVEQQRQSRSTLFWAKRLDDANQLDDHLVTALAQPDPATSGFEQAVVNSLVLRLQSMQLRFPDVRLERVWLLAPAAVIALATGFVDWHRRQRPDDDGTAAVILDERVRDFTNRIDLTDPAHQADARLAKQAEEMQHAFNDLVGKKLDKESVLSRVSAQSQQLDAFDRDRSSVTDAALQLGDPSSQRAQAIVGAVRSGDSSALNQALDVLQKAVSGQVPPPLSPEERSEIEGVMRELAKAAADAGVAEKLRAAADAIADPTRDKEAAAHLGALKAPLAAELTRDGATKKLEQSLRALLAATRSEANRQAAAITTRPGTGDEVAHSDGGSSGAAGTTGTQVKDDRNVEDEDTRAVEGGGGAPAPGSGSGSATSPDYKGGAPESATTAKDERISAPWVGAPVSQLVAAAARGDQTARDAARVQLGAQRRTAESEVRREEIPPGYAQPIQRYFFNLQQESQWKPSK